MTQLIAESGPGFFDITALFGREAPLHVDLGCGDGSFLQALATQNPSTNFLGVERLLRRVRSSDRKAAQLPNVRVVRAETLFVLRHVLPPRSVEAFYLLFPDPWPKRRHHRRRLITPNFLDVIGNCLTRGGSLFIATDYEEYFAAIRQVLSARDDFKITGGEWTLPTTTFEQKFVTAGLNIYRMELRKISPVT